ncbi:hypothetical protein BKA62DRAFT_64145 [Auriculariales sp. MPI-PUGE-AT-0066]|nr:hypothetical protein BKA62DRAFT_64145 [Auriculariales sp. MPI-PUGE-AT-0066]
MPAQYTGHDLQLLHYTLAPWMVGCFLDLLTQGILFCQFNNYLNWYKEDPLFLRTIVWILMLLNTVKCVDSCAVVWITFVDYFGDLEGAHLLNYVAWWQTGVPLMGACINFFCQLYFLYRLLVISKKHWIVYPVGLVVVFSWLAVVIATVFIKLQQNNPIQYWFAAHLSATFASDLLMTMSSAYFLLQSKKNSLRQTQTLIDTLIRLTWQSAAPAAVVATLNLILSQAVAQEFLISTIPNELLPKVYSIAMLWTINSRKNIRLVNASGKTSSSEGVSNPLSRGLARTGEVELGRIQVHKQTETVSHVEWQTRARESADDLKGDSSFYGRGGPAIIIEETTSSDRSDKVSRAV